MCLVVSEMRVETCVSLHVLSHFSSVACGPSSFCALPGVYSIRSARPANNNNNNNTSQNCSAARKLEALSQSSLRTQPAVQTILRLRGFFKPRFSFGMQLTREHKSHILVTWQESDRIFVKHDRTRARNVVFSDNVTLSGVIFDTGPHGFLSAFSLQNVH